MDSITLVWTEADERKTQRFVLSSTKKPWTVRIGRDPAQCDLVLPSLTESDCKVSRLHVEIVFKPAHCSFYLRNLKLNNPVRVDGKTVFGSEVELEQGSTIILGETILEVVSLSADPVPVTVFASIGPSKFDHVDKILTEVEEGLLQPEEERQISPSPSLSDDLSLAKSQFSADPGEIITLTVRAKKSGKLSITVAAQDSILLQGVQQLQILSKAKSQVFCANVPLPQEGWKTPIVGKVELFPDDGGTRLSENFTILAREDQPLSQKTEDSPSPKSPIFSESEGRDSKGGSKNVAQWWKVYSQGQHGNLLERAQQAAFTAFRDGRSIPDVVEMLSVVPEHRQVMNSDQFEHKHEFVMQAMREGNRRYLDYLKLWPFQIPPVHPQVWQAACGMLERYGLERKVLDRAKDIVLTARWEDRLEVGFPLRNENFQVVGVTYIDSSGRYRSEGDTSGYYRVALGRGKLKGILIGESPIETLKLCQRYRWTKEGRLVYISINDDGQLPVKWVRNCLKRTVEVWGLASSPNGKARMESLAKELPGMQVINLKADRGGSASN